MFFRISNPASGLDLGVYRGEDKAAALDTYARAAGYADFAAACAVTGGDPADDGGLRVTRIGDPSIIVIRSERNGLPHDDDHRAPIDLWGWYLWQRGTSRSACYLRAPVGTAIPAGFVEILPDQVDHIDEQTLVCNPWAMFSVALNDRNTAEGW